MFALPSSCYFSSYSRQHESSDLSSVERSIKRIIVKSLYCSLGLWVNHRAWNLLFTPAKITGHSLPDINRLS